ncbi:hypothetical protein JNJ66_01770 [Candidatus Saccharibacteria bacterium]|nr:hypothetical protein [Candidatus Saccharibacteria bacterium]
MPKTVIYIDTEDDITAVIGKVKAAESDIVALVPPKRTGMLQSAVNLKLLKRAASGARKHVVLITSDPSLRSLAGGVMIPSAKNLQSRPEIASAGAPIDDEEDVVNGSELAVGDLDDALGNGDKAVPTRSDRLGDKEAQAVGAATLAAARPAPVRAGAAATGPAAAGKDKPGDAKGHNKVAIPDFGRFRKRLYLGGLGAVLLGVLIYWAYWIAPTARVAITAKTELTNIEESVSLDPAAEFDASKNLLPSETQELKKTAAVDFDATGKKDVGEKAKGQIVFKNCETPTAQTIDAGTAVSVNGQNYATQAAVTVAGGTGNFITGCTSAGSSPAVSIVASDIGENYNLANGTKLGVSGHSSELTATVTAAVSGGSKRTITVVSQADVDKAKQSLNASDDNAARTELFAKFNGNTTGIRESFKVQTGEPAVSPAIDAEATKAKLTAETTYTAIGVRNQQLDEFLNKIINEDMDNKERQSIYDNGRKEMKVSDFQSLDGGRASFRLKTTGYIGSKIDQKSLKEQMSGKVYGEIESIVRDVPNVERVDITFSPFWVTKAPSPDKITITLDVKKNGE